MGGPQSGEEGPVPGPGFSPLRYYGPTLHALYRRLPSLRPWHDQSNERLETNGHATHLIESQRRPEGNLLSV